jgi:hypothetical protein
MNAFASILLALVVLVALVGLTERLVTGTMARTERALEWGLAPLDYLQASLARLIAPMMMMGISADGPWIASPEGRSGRGASFNQAATPFGFNGETCLQPSQPTQAAISYALGVSAIAVYSSTQAAPASVAADTTAERDFTVTGVQAGSVVYVTKPTAQAGLGIAGARVKAADTVAVTFINPTAGAVVPTTSQKYRIVEIRGALVQTAALTFATAVAADSTREYIHTLASSARVKSAKVAPGLNNAASSAASSVANTTTKSATTLPALDTTANKLRGTPHTLIVNKPTLQADLGIIGVRVVDNNQIGLLFANTGVAEDTPTDETYSFVSINGVALGQSIVTYLVDVGTVAAILTITTQEVDYTLNGVAATDKVVGVSKPTLKAGVGIAGARVKSAGVVAVTYANPTAGSVTPDADETYSIFIDKTDSDFGPILAQFSVAITPAAVATLTTAEETFTVTGLVSGAPVVVNVALGAGYDTELGSKLPTGFGVVGARVSATDTLALVFYNGSAASITPGTLQITVMQAPVGASGDTDGADGSAVVYPYNEQLQALVEGYNALQDALAVTGFWAGA